MFLLLIFIVVVVYVVVVVVIVIVYCVCCCLCCCSYCSICVKQLIFYRCPDSIPKSGAIADTKEIGKFIKNPHVTRVVLPLTGMDGSLPNFTFNFRFYSFIHTDKV